MSRTIHEIPRQMVDLRPVCFTGRVLDIGGGGEGVISQHSPTRAIAIDRSREELEEAPDVGLKIVMDACNLAFLDRSFENATCFYSLMYMDSDCIRRVIDEAWRVLRPGGFLWIWDVEMPPPGPAEVLLVRLDVRVSDVVTIDAGYGVLWNREQTLDGLRRTCERAGLLTVAAERNQASFLLKVQKPV